jgi:hypothetical protein
MHEFKAGWSTRGRCKYPGCGQPEEAHGGDEEEARGPFGPKMPRFGDLPQYTLPGQILKRFSR